MAGDGARLQLTALPGAAAADLVAALADGKPDGNLMRLAEGAAGNPLYITELVAALSRSSSLTIAETGVAQLASGSAPGSLSAAIADRLGFVARPVREVLQAAALLGMDFAISDLAVVLGRSVTDLIPAVHEACAAGVLAESGHGLRFRHPLIRSALYDEMPASVRTAWHRDAGRALAEAGAPTDRVARQLLRAVGEPAGTAEPMDEWMLTWLARTADLLVGQAPGVAAELLTRAVASPPAGSARHDWLASRLADALYRIGEIGFRPGRWRIARWTMPPSPISSSTCTGRWRSAACWPVSPRSPWPRWTGRWLRPGSRPGTRPGCSCSPPGRTELLPRRGRKPGQVASSALAAASEAADNWAMGWALHVLTLRDRGAGADDRRAAVVRPGADRDPIRSGPC